jgi:cytochrome b
MVAPLSTVEAAACMNEATKPVRVWDLPTRIFHWVLATSVVASIITAHVGGNAMQWHVGLGMVALILLTFRILWGLVGGRWSRFASFLYSPGTVLRYLRGEVRAGEHLDVGHNPLGAGSVFALLTLLAVQVATGLVADDEIATRGPLNALVSEDTAKRASGWHADIGQWILIALIVLHVAAIVFYKVRKGKNLVAPMLVGDKDLPADTPASADGWRQRLFALVLLVASWAFAGWVWTRGG